MSVVLRRDRVHWRQPFPGAVLANVQIEYTRLRESFVVFDGVAEAVGVALSNALLQRARLEVNLQPIRASVFRAHVPVDSFGGAN